MTPTSLDPLTRFLLLHSVLLIAGLAASALLRRKYGPSAATLAQRLTLTAVAASALLSLAPLPQMDAPILPPAPVESPSFAAPTDFHREKYYPPIPVVPSVPDIEPNLAIAFPSKRLVVTLLVSAVWIIGVLIGASGLLMGIARLRRLRQDSLPLSNAAVTAELTALMQGTDFAPPALRQYAGSVPFLAGLRCPTLYLPTENELRGDALTAALAHEAMHVIRRDLLWNLAARIACLILWFQPLLWLFWRDMERTAEDACDEAALQRGIAPRQYADLLLRLSDYSRPPLTIAAGMSAFRSQTGKRIARILKGQTMPPLTARVRGLIACAVILLTLSAAVLSHARLRPAPQEATANTALTPAPLSYNDAEEIFRTSRHKRGSENAAIAVVEFTDFQCPSCRRAFRDTTSALGANDDGIQFAVRHRPLTEMHKNALALALAAETAGQQGKFWQAREALMSVPEPSVADIPARLKRAGIDEALYRKAQGDSARESAVREDTKVGEMYNINSTPSYLILARRQKKAYLAIGAQDIKQALNALTTEAQPPSPVQEPLINYSCIEKPIKDALREIFQQANAKYELPADFDGSKPITIDVKSVPLSHIVEQIGIYMRKDLELVRRADGVYRIEEKRSGVITGQIILPKEISGENVVVNAILTDEYQNNPDARKRANPKTEKDMLGNFSISPCGPYSYRVKVMDYNHEWIAEKFPVANVKIGQETQLPAIRLIRAGFIEGTIKRADGSPFPHVQLFVDSAFYAVRGPMSDSPETDENGKFRLVVVPGNRTVVVSTSTIYAQDDFTNGDRAYASKGPMRLKGCNVTAGKTVTLPDILLK